MMTTPKSKSSKVISPKFQMLFMNYKIHQTTKSRKALKNNRFKLTPNEWDTADTIGNNYFIYYLVANDSGKNVFIIQNPVEQYKQGNIKVDKNLVVEFSQNAGQWQTLLEIQN